jgi:hypothetical protein
LGTDVLVIRKFLFELLGDQKASGNVISNIRSWPKISWHEHQSIPSVIGCETKLPVIWLPLYMDEVMYEPIAKRQSGNGQSALLCNHLLASFFSD